MPPLRGSVRAGDQPHPVDPTEVAVDEGVARLRAVLRAHGQAEVGGARPAVAASLLAGSRARWGDGARIGTRSQRSTVRGWRSVMDDLVPALTGGHSVGPGHRHPRHSPGRAAHREKVTSAGL